MMFCDRRRSARISLSSPLIVPAARAWISTLPSAVARPARLALGLLQEMTRQELQVSDELAIVGYDGIEFAAAAAVPLTSVRRSRHLIGRTAADLLAEEVATGADHQHRQIEYLPELVVRGSTRGSRRSSVGRNELPMGKGVSRIG
jgi:DNA-binding LacI/PurR family transcriptional regulator